MKKGIYLNDTIHGLVSLSEYEKRVISSIGFNRLHDVYQNSTVYLTFPTNRTKRFEHSIGTMKLCSDIFYYSIINAEKEALIEFYEMFKEEYTEILKEVAADTNFCEHKLAGVTPENLPKIEFDKWRHSLIPNKVPADYQVIHLLLMQSIRVAALLHDIGHPPFSHVVEYAMKAVYNEYKEADSSGKELVNTYTSIMSRYFEDKKKLHEEMGDEISESILKEIIVKISDDEYGKYDENLFEVLILKSVISIFKEKGKFVYLHRIIDSSLDGDRLDYVTRDSINSGMNSGVIDYTRIINDMKLIIDQHEIFFCIPLKAINSVEDFIKRRYNIYKDIIYHHRVIKTDYLLDYSVRDLIKLHLERTSEPAASTNKIVIPFDISGLWFPLGNATTIEKSNALSQWNDSWLMTVLKQIFYTDYYRKTSINPGSQEYILQNRLSELLRNNKCYYSMIKRSENFKVIDDAVKTVLEESKQDIVKLVERTNNLSKELNEGPVENKTIDIKGTLDFIDAILGTTNNKPKGFVLSYISRRCQAIQIISFSDFVEKIVKEEAEKVFANTKLYDTITVFKEISIGLNEPIYFYNYNDEILTLDDISGISDILWLDSDYLPVFYVYILVKNGEDIVKEKREVLLNDIGKNIGIKIKEIVVGILNNSIKQMEECLCAK